MTYVALFPQLIAGPIVRYSAVEKQLHKRTITWDDVDYGITRFIIGLSKKVLIANAMGMVADAVFTTEMQNINILVFFTILFSPAFPTQTLTICINIKSFLIIKISKTCCFARTTWTNNHNCLAQNLCSS